MRVGTLGIVLIVLLAGFALYTNDEGFSELYITAANASSFSYVIHNQLGNDHTYSIHITAGNTTINRFTINIKNNEKSEFVQEYSGKERAAIRADDIEVYFSPVLMKKS